MPKGAAKETQISQLIISTCVGYEDCICVSHYVPQGTRTLFSCTLERERPWRDM